MGKSMINKLYGDAQRLKAKGNSKWKYLYKINKLIVNICYPPIAYFSTKKGVDENSDVIVSLTTYPARIKSVWVTVASLLNQTYKPRKVVLYLAKEQFPNGLEELPAKLLRLQKRGLEIVFVEDDLKPHKKYYYAFSEYRNDSVITADDDIFYPENHIELLVEASKRFPDSIICARSHQIKYKDPSAKEFAPYNSWPEILTDESDLFTMPIGCNGVLYKPARFSDELFDADKIKKYALYTDDIWLKVMELKDNIKAYNCVKEPLVYFDNIFTMNTGLWHTNTSDSNNRNDIVWNELVDLYPFIRENLSN